MKSIFKRTRSTKKTDTPRKPQEATTAPLREKRSKAGAEKRIRLEPPQLVTSCGQSVGKQRDQNEDSLFAFSITMGGGVSSQPVGLYIIADGMGGHQYGEVASSVATRTMAGYLLKKLHTFLSNPSEALNESLQEIMRTAINEAQRAVMKTAPGSGTTLTAVLILSQQMTIAHVGDSRIYIIKSEGSAELLTRDHSLVKRLEELGQLTAEEAAIHPQRNVLYRALGQGDILEPDVFTAPFPQTGKLLLCSDGLWSVVSEKDIAQTINSSSDLQTACQNLVVAANTAGGPDNISVILIQLLT